MPVTDEEIEAAKERVAALHEQVAEAERAAVQRIRDADKAKEQARLADETARLERRLADVQGVAAPDAPEPDVAPVETPATLPFADPDAPVVPAETEGN